MTHEGGSEGPYKVQFSEYAKELDEVVSDASPRQSRTRYCFG